MNSIPIGIALIIALSALVGSTAKAEETGRLAGEIEEIVVVGSRRHDRSAADSPVPVDIIGSEALRDLGAGDMDSLLSAVVPSYNVDTQPISDAATVIRPASLRGLPSDATLILVNGKRRHRGSVITWLGGGISDGAHGPDISAIPASALDRVEVLRDGASAQYGSDAIAGVINFVLREDDQGGSIEARWGEYFEGDGSSLTLSGNIGFGLTDAGFLNLSGEFREADPTSRSVQRADAQGLIDAGNTAVRQPEAQVWGSPEVSEDYKLFFNAGFEVGNNSELYAFGNWAERTVEGGFFFRNPHTRGGVFAGPEVDGVPTVKVADLSPDGMSGNCPAIPVRNRVADAAAIAAVGAAPDCFSFIQRFPGGFTPRFGGDVTDYGLTLGLRGELANGWFYDLSLVTGSSEVEHFMHNTINPQLARRGVDIPTAYYPGSYTEKDTTFDAGVSKPLEFGVLSAPLYLAMGLEYRRESFERGAGDPASYLVDASLARQGFGVGSNGFPGLPPRHAGDESRDSYAAYVDVETDLTEALLVGVAVRFEDYDDFSNTFDSKFTLRYQLTDAMAVRGAVSSGFRAPTVGQSTVRNVSTVFSDGGLEDRVTLPPSHPISRQKGASALKPEESVNVTAGLIWNIGDVDLTLDYYSVEIENRIAQSSTLALTPEDIDTLLAQGVSDASSFASVRFFSNDFDTTNQGIDLVVTAPLDMGSGDTLLTIAANRNHVDVDKRNPDIISDHRVRQLKGALPKHRISATLNHLVGDWRFLARIRHYGAFYGVPADVESWARTYDARQLVDAEVAYSLNEAVTLVVGAQNLFDRYPQKTLSAAREGVGMPYPENSPYGFNGGFYYFRVIRDFD